MKTRKLNSSSKRHFELVSKIYDCKEEQDQKFVLLRYVTQFVVRVKYDGDWKKHKLTSLGLSNSKLMRRKLAWEIM